MQKAVLITGGLGFLGRSIIQECQQARIKVSVLDRHSQRKPLPPGIKFFSGDIQNLSLLRKALKGVNQVIHLAATTVPQSSEENRLHDLQSNVGTTLQLLEECTRRKIKRFIFASSGGTIYGVQGKSPIRESSPTCPVSAHGVMKLTIENYLHLFRHAYNLEPLILRISNLYGEGQDPTRPQGIISTLFDRLLRKKSIPIWGDGSIVRDYVHVEDGARACLLALRYRGKENVFNIGTGKGTSINQLLDHAEKISGIKPRIKWMKRRKLDAPRNVLDNNRARTHLKWEPKINLKTGLQQMFESMKKTCQTER
jgi:UDP-glucose 4-epimerase